MDTNRINLLPPERQRALSRGYVARLGVVAAFTVTALACVAGILLVPTYVFLTQSAAAKEERLANIESVLAAADEQELSAHLAALSGDAAALVALGSAASGSSVLRAALAVSRPGVALSGFAYAPATAKAPGTLSISGTAATRDALRRYQIALSGASFAASADLPVSAYAKDINISFTVAVTLRP